MQLKKQSVEAWQNEKHYSKEKGIMPAKTQSQDKKFQTNQPCEVRRSGQVRSQHLLFVQFSP